MKCCSSTPCPFSWSVEPIQATLASSRSVPNDTLLNAWNLDTNAAWWWFDESLPFQTVSRVHEEASPEMNALAAKTGIRALLFGWFYAQAETVTIPKGSPFGAFERVLDKGMPFVRELGISCWIDDAMRQFQVTPSQTFTWHEGETLDAMLARVRRTHIAIYGPGGRFEHAPQVGLDVFMAATEGIARFVLSAMAWLGQKVLAQADGHVERHRRKEFARKVRPLDAVKVVSLRRVEHAPRNVESSEHHREYACRFQVDGHWRNQACGPKHGDRRLTWVTPHMKGDVDKPLRVPQHKVYKVNR
jgi:hypothetical protein